MVTFINFCVFGWTFVLIHRAVALDTDFTIRKCCPSGARLMSTSKVRCTTMSALVPDNATSTSGYEWIPHPLEGLDGEEALLDIPRLKVEYGISPTCGDGERFRTTLYFNAADYAFKLFAHNGSLVEVKKFGNHTWRMGYFTSKSFCVDSVRDPEYTHAAKICFCVEKMCILKCCGHGKYLNTEKNICLPNKKTLPNYLPEIYDMDLLPLANTPSDVYFMSALPHCKPRGFDLPPKTCIVVVLENGKSINKQYDTNVSEYNILTAATIDHNSTLQLCRIADSVLNGVDETATSAFFVQSNGNVVLIDEKSNRTVKALNYCVDMIQTDEETVGPNLAVCQNTKSAVKRGAPVSRSVKVKTAVNSERSSSSTTSYSALLPTLSIFALFQPSFI